MAQRQVQAIVAAIADIYGMPNESGMLCCTIEALNAGGTAGNEPADVARPVDETFTKMLGCGDRYEFRASTEDLG